MGRKFGCICLLLLSTGLPAADAPKKVIRVGGGYSVPWAYLAPDGNPTGFYIEVMKEAARREGLEVDVVFRKDGPEKALGGGAIDLWTAAVANEERRKRLYFTEPWWAQEHYLGVLASSSIHKPEDLDGKKVVYSDNPPFTADLAKVLPGARLERMPDLRNRFRAVCSGEADAVLFYHETSLFAVTGSNEMAECRERGLRLIPITQPIMRVSITSLPENQALADRFRARIEEMEKDRTLARLAEFPLTGNDSVDRMLQAARTEHRQQLQELSLGFLALVLLLGGVAHLRLRRANQRTEDALAVAEEALRVKGEFLATISHEIRTPMTAVLGYMDMLMGTPLRHDQRRFAAEVTQATEALLTLMTTVLRYASPTPATVVVENVSFDTASVFDACQAAEQLEAENKGLDLTVEMDPGVPHRLMGDAVRLRQAVLNLMGNAVKFTGEGWVRVRVTYAEGFLCCEVSDSGAGIPKEKRHLIFEPFKQLDSSDKRPFGGVGLGLAVVADICKQRGGEILVDEAPGGGARFRLRLSYRTPPDEGSWLPKAMAGRAILLAGESEAVKILGRYLANSGMPIEWVKSAAELQALRVGADERVLCFVDGERFGLVLPKWRTARTTVLLVGRLGYLRNVSEEDKLACDDVLPLPPAARSVRELVQPPAARHTREVVKVAQYVLVADDNAVNRRVLTAMLERLGCRVETARNGKEAFEAAQRERYTAILMDCQMPVMNGYEAAEEIRKLPNRQGDVPICGVSASLDAETRRKCEASGMTEYLPKPVTLEMLQDLLARMTARQIIEENLQDEG